MSASSSLWHFSPTGSERREEPLPRAGDGFIEIKSRYSLISTGTEKLVATGLVPPEFFDEMRVPYMGGRFSFPVKYGYSLVGEVVTNGHPLHGRLVHLLHPHQDRCIVSEADAFPVPEGVTAKRATLASNLETAVTAIWDAGAGVGDRVAVVGFGIIGSLVARLLSLVPAVQLTVFEKNETRREAARHLGFSTKSDWPDGSFDLAFHTSGTGEGLQTCIELVGMEGKIIELSWYGTKEVTVRLGGSFHTQRKQIISSQVSNIPVSHSARWDFRRRREVVFELLKNSVFDRHITTEIPFDETPAFFEKLRKGQVFSLSTCIVY